MERKTTTTITTKGTTLKAGQVGACGTGRDGFCFWSVIAALKGKVNSPGKLMKGNVRRATDFSQPSYY